jgi:hypothetical protein
MLKDIVRLGIALILTPFFIIYNSISLIWESITFLKTATLFSIKISIVGVVVMGIGFIILL